jgi:uncharacterized membrane protein YeaQ/YmgE (transglycosylase-associated protein family)
MSILVFILFGFIVGLIARAIMPGRQKLGWMMTTIVGVVGSFLGGLIGSLISSRPVTEITPAGLIGSIIGALLVLAVMAPLSRRLHV